MALTFGNTKDLGGAINCMCYAPAGFGKTVLGSTAPTPLFISAENGLLSIKDKGIPFLEINSMEDFKEAFEFVSRSDSAKGFETICIDSITDIAETVLIDFKKGVKDPRQAYGQLADEMLHEMNRWKHFNSKHVYITAKQARLDGAADGSTQYIPTMPGKQLPQQLPYWGDELFALRIVKDEEGKDRRVVQTQPDIHYYAKDRSGKLEFYEYPDLTLIFNKIRGI